MVVGTDGQPPGPHPHVHILPCPYSTRRGQARPIRHIVGASGERRCWVGPCGRPSGVWGTGIVARPVFATYLSTNGPTL
ncbi:MAG: hypothetical protein ACJ797_11635 [Ktedonobacteraceae bacterium]